MAGGVIPSVIIMVLVWALIVPVVIATQAAAMLCPGGDFRCPDEMTCCKLANKQYGCCPYPNANCCPDHVHCCPHNLKCAVEQQACLKDGVPIRFLWLVKVHPELVSRAEETEMEQVDPPASATHLHSNRLDDLESPSVEEGDCPDGRRCPGSYTCCKMYHGDYGCCPYRDAMCCSDGFHCCPHDAQCDASTGGCYNVERNWTSVFPMKIRAPPAPPQRRTPAVAVDSEVADPGGKCPDGHPCLEKFTCCKVPDQGYGCCPYSNAVCCTDNIHCCPQGSNCNTTTGTCDKPGKRVSLPSYSLLSGELTMAPSKLTNSMPIHPQLPNSMCPDKRSRCPDGNTCCQLKDGSYGCCPMPEATCCSDHVHCCPRGYRCHSAGCYKENSHRFLLPFLQHIPVVPQVMMPEQGNAQPELENVREEVEERTREEVAEKSRVSVDDVVCPDHQSQCPDGNTCCQLSSDEYGCCPMPQATCCSDHVHCCPRGYKCHSAGCYKENSDRIPLPFVHHLPVVPQVVIPEKDNAQPELESVREEVEEMTRVSVDDVVCPDHQSQCPDGNTCCRISSDGYGCCPMPQATCCGDMVHCCPHGYWCSEDGCDRLPSSPNNFPLHLAQSLVFNNTVTRSLDSTPQIFLML